MTQTETLKLAISRLEWFIDSYPHDITVSKEDFLRPFKEALAQPEQEPVAWRWPYKFKDIGETGAYEYHSHEFACLAHLPKGEPLYTHPPQRKPLTDGSLIDEGTKKPEQEPVACTDVMCACRGGPCVSCPDGEHEKAQLEQKPALGMKHSVMYSNYKD